MFKIEELTFNNYLNQTYTYKFVKGINYFRGTNNSGKTVFYKLLDYMLGSSKEIKDEDWYKSIKEITIKIIFNDITYLLTRTKEKDVNYISTGSEILESRNPISYREYYLKLGNIFTSQNSVLEDIKTFTGEDLSFRTFTMFNFLGEKRQGLIQDFFDKCSTIEYIVKLSPLLNFIFNKNLKRIFALEEQLKQLEKDIKRLESNKNKYDFVNKEINKNIIILGLNIQYNGKNSLDVKNRLEQIKTMTEFAVNSSSSNISELTIMLENINEQIKVYQNYKTGIKQIEKETQNRKILLNKLNSIIKNNNEFEYLLKPINDLLLELDTTISFSQNSINAKTIDTLKTQRALIKTEIKKNDAKFKLYSLKEKEKAVVLLENYLSQDLMDCNEELNEKIQLVKKIKEELKELKNKDDSIIINNLSKYITDLYNSAKDVSSFVKIDTDKNRFRIQYIKKGNILQPMIDETILNKEKNTNEQISSNYYTGSMARHTLIQICGYFGFLKLLLSKNVYPLVPIFVGDHLSKSFDDTNVNALGTIINEALADIGKDNIQLFLFDDEDYSKLTLEPDYAEDLIVKNDKGEIVKSGFIPFYKPNK